MPIHMKYLEAFQENEYMHVIAKAVGLNVLFKTDNNKIYFLNQYFIYLSGYVDTYCFCLLTNHVHWLVKCRSKDKLLRDLNQLPKKKKHQQDFIDGNISFERALEYQWKDFFISYSLTFNYKYKRHGTLFVNPFRRITIQDQAHLIQLIIYIHANQIKYGIEKKIDRSTFTSYHSILGSQISKLNREAVLELFGGRSSFIELHQNTIDYYYVHPRSIED
jgi:REP element-mobilizing transposase RayT